MTAISTLLDTDGEFCSLVGTGNLDKAAIFNTHGTSVWASSHGFTVCRPIFTTFVHISYTPVETPGIPRRSSMWEES